jgi:phosphoglucosamine mutase
MEYVEGDSLAHRLQRERIPLMDMLAIGRQLAAALAAAQSQLDGEGRILVRYSGTENKVRVMVEGPDDALIRRIAESLREVLAREIPPS